MDRRQIQTGRRDEMGRHGFVTARQQDQTVPGNDVAVDFDEIGDDFPAEKNIIHAIVTFGPAVTDIRRMETGRLAAAFQYALTYLFCQDTEMITARVAFALDIIDKNLQLVQIPFRPVHSQFQCIDLGPYFPRCFTPLYIHIQHSFIFVRKSMRFRILIW